MRVSADVDSRYAEIVIYDTYSPRQKPTIPSLVPLEGDSWFLEAETDCEP